MNTFIFTCGDINGVGPELVIKTLNKIAKKKSEDKFLFVCPYDVFISETKKIKPQFSFEIVSSTKYSADANVSVIQSGHFKNEYGIPTKHSGKAAFKSIEIAFDIIGNSFNKAMITAPISKIALSIANINHPGHTEMLARWCGVKNFAMMFLSKSMKAALLTIHQPIKKISRLLTEDLLSNKLDVLLSSLKSDFGIKTPKIALLGLNPHAGENGLIGDEEKKIIIPFMKNYSKRKQFFGPYSSDAFFGMKMYLNFDMVLGMYHDQILNPFKLLNFNKRSELHCRSADCSNFSGSWNRI